MAYTRTINEFIRHESGVLSVLIRQANFWIVLAVDVLLLVAAYFLAYLVRFEGNITHQMNQIIVTLPLIIGFKLPIFYIFSLYQGMWRYTSYTDLINIVKATTVSVILIVIFLLYTHRFQGYSRSVFFLDGIFTFLFITLYRCSIRYFSNHNLLSSRFLPNASPGKRKKRLLLIGAGDAAEKVVREIQANTDLPYKIVGFVDDDTTKVGHKIHGIPIVGLINDLDEHARRTEANELLIAIASATGKQMKKIVAICQQSNIKFKVLPGLGELINGKISIKTMRDISYKDLLGRKEVRLEQDKIGSYLTDQTILVTGAGGSIGSELCRQILRFNPKRMVLFDAGEENLYSIQMEIIHEFNYTHCVPILGKLQSHKLLDRVMACYQPDVVFHAAAYKHVPLIEINPWEAAFNNIQATQNLIKASIDHKVKRFVLVSTDKAVRPTNIMGTSKRITELLMLAYGQLIDDEESANTPPPHKTIFQAVRFGNVLGSSGSVIPLFIRQIEMGGPVTVTHPEITRYFMSIEEAAQLILQAGSMGKGNELFILQMGQSIKIVDMAKGLIRLAGKEPDTEIEIKFTGLREGEKLYEELITVGEGIVETSHEKIMVLKGNSIAYDEIIQHIDTLLEKAKDQDHQAIKEIFKIMVPEYTPDTHVKSVLQFK